MGLRNWHERRQYCTWLQMLLPSAIVRFTAGRTRASAPTRPVLDRNRKKPPLRAASFRFRSAALVAERNVQAGGDDDVVRLRSGRRIGNVNRSELILPAQPLADLRYCAEVEGRPIIARLLQVRVKIQVLRDVGALSQFVGQFIAQGERHVAIGYAVGNECRGSRDWNDLGAIRIRFVRIVDAGEQIQCGLIRLDGVETEAAAVNLA